MKEFCLNVKDRIHHVEMPKGAKLLKFDVIEEEVGESKEYVLTLWAEVETENTDEEKIFRVLGTGDEIEENSTYVGTAFDNEGLYVWHLYELSEAKDENKKE